jgi:sulfatase maturation enzyme AslB (radical SAM superfamily)
VNCLGRNKRIVLKLGGECNLSCPHCHDSKVSYEYNEDIIKWVNDNDIEEVFLGGGEPLIYFDKIKEIVPKLTSVKLFAMTTNGTLLNNEVADFCNQYNITVALSYDGVHSQRAHCLPDYDALRRVKHNAVSQVCYHGNMDIEQILFDTRLIGKQHHIKGFQKDTNTPVFVHQTEVNPNEETTKEDAKEYILQYAKRLEVGLMNYKCDGNIYDMGFAYSFIRQYVKHEPYKDGCRCCNHDNVTLTLDGRFLLCPYGDTYVGDIYKGIDWDLVESYIPDKCKTCPFKLLCGPSCIANITDNECYIFRVLYRHYKKLLKKYNIDETALLNRPEWSEE